MHLHPKRGMWDSSWRDLHRCSQGSLWRGWVMQRSAKERLWNHLQRGSFQISTFKTITNPYYFLSQICATLPTRECHSVPKEFCIDVPKEICEDVPKEVCVPVPGKHCEKVVVKRPREVCLPPQKVRVLEQSLPSEPSYWVWYNIILIFYDNFTNDINNDSIENQVFICPYIKALDHFKEGWGQCILLTSRKKGTDLTLSPWFFWPYPMNWLDQVFNLTQMNKCGWAANQ